ncbi:hypothetical protein FI667_g15314, partial [Globisporangium splendens]
MNFSQVSMCWLQRLIATVLFYLLFANWSFSNPWKRLAAVDKNQENSRPLLPTSRFPTSCSPSHAISNFHASPADIPAKSYSKQSTTLSVSTEAMLTPTSSMKSLLAVAMFAVASSRADADTLSTGVCYSPWHHPSVTAGVVQADLSQIKQYFSSVRTYHAQFSGVNAIEMAAQAGVRIAVGIQMGDATAIPTEIKAACGGAKKHPEIVDAIYVGNENLVNGNFGTFTSAQLVDYIGQLRTCIQNANISIGTVQRINEWKVAASVGELAKVSDVIGVNIYPFFTNSNLTPIKRLGVQWQEINSLYPGGKVHLTETGWPRSGSPVSGNTPSKETAASFLKDYAV